MSEKRKHKQRGTARTVPAAASSTLEALDVDATEDSPSGDHLSSYVHITVSLVRKYFYSVP